MKHIIYFSIILFVFDVSTSNADTISRSAERIALAFKADKSNSWGQLQAKIGQKGVDPRFIAACFEAAAAVWPDEIAGMVKLAARSNPKIAPLLTAVVTGRLPGLMKVVVAAAIEGVETADAALTTVVNPITKKAESITARIKRSIEIAAIAAQKYGAVDNWLWSKREDDSIFAELSRQILSPVQRLPFNAPEVSPAS